MLRYKTILLYFMSIIMAMTYGIAQANSSILKNYQDVTLIFIPGIYGSTLKDSEGIIFWGDNGIGDKGLSLIDYPELKANLFENVKFSIGAFSYTFKGYSGVDNSLNNLGENVLVFPYDWRLSNKRSANHLNEFLCKEFRNIKKQDRIIFVAHSMGGLVLRHWIRDYLSTGRAGCGSISKNNIDRFVFAGTPNLGSMEPVWALFKGKTRIEENPLYASLFTGGMAKYAITFESPYELLPSANIAGPECKGSRNDQLMRLAKDIGTGDELPIYLNKIRNWKILGIPTAIPDGMDRKETLALISRRIRSASAAVCELISYDIPPEIAAKMDFIVGELRDSDKPRAEYAKSTVDGITVVIRPNESPIIDEEIGKGDGTVPYWSAEPIALGLRGEANLPHPTNEPHQSILDDIGILAHLQRIVEGAAYDVAALGERPVDIRITNKASWAAATKEIAALPLDRMSPEVYAASINYLSQKAEDIGLSGLEIYRITKGYTGIDKEKFHALGFASASNVGTELNDQSLAWANQNSTIALYKAGNEQLAIASAIRTGQINIHIKNKPMAHDIDKPLNSVESGWRSVATSYRVRKSDPSLSKAIENSNLFDPDVFLSPVVKQYDVLPDSFLRGSTLKE